MPQSLTSDWHEMLGDRAKEIHNKYLHTLGNLTLTGNNSNLSNKFISEYNYFIEANYFYSVLEIKMICNTLDNSEINKAFDSLLESIK